MRKLHGKERVVDMKLFDPYAGYPKPTLEQLSEYVNSAPTPEERNRRKMQVHGYAYSVGPQKLVSLFDYIKQQNESKGG